MILAAGDVERTVEVAATEEGRFAVTVDGHTFALEVAPQADGSYRVRHGDVVESVHCVVDRATLHLFWRGRAYRLQRDEARRSSAPRSTGRLEAPMPGRVVELKVAAGDAVSAGQALLVLEAMKMENVLRAPRAGRVRAVSVAAGDRVTAGAVLVELE